MATLLPGQKYEGGWAEPVADSKGKYPNIICFDINGAPALAFFVPWYVTYNAGHGTIPPYCCENCGFANIPVDYDFSTKKFIYVRINTYDVGSEGNSIGIYTITNNAENNAKYKDAAFNGFEYVSTNKNYHMQAWPKAPIENIGMVNGEFELEGGITVRDNQLFISGMGHSPARKYGTVDYWMTATIFVDGKVFMKKSLELSDGPELWPDDPNKPFTPIGSARFDLPEPKFGQKTVLKLEGAYTFNNGNGNYIVPEYYYAKKEVNIDIRAKLPEEAPIL